MKKTPILFLDFDETLFRHLDMLDWLKMKLPGIGINPESFLSSLDSFHSYQGTKSRLYDHQRHWMHATGKDWEYVSGELERMMRVDDIDFCYKDVHDLLKRVTDAGIDVRLLTYGHGDYQRYKIRTCQHIERLKIPIHVVSGPKNAFLAKNYPDRDGILVDDKHPMDLPHGWHHVHIVRHQNATTEESPHVTRITSLNELSPIVKKYIKVDLQ